MKRTPALFLSLLLLITLSACGETPLPSAGEKLDVVTTLFPYYDLARTLAGDRASVTLLCSAGRESHSYEPTPHDVLRVTDADLFFYNGGVDEQWATELLAASGHGAVLTGMELISVREEELPEGATSHEHAHAHEDHAHEAHAHDEEARGGAPEYDEHIWTSPRNMRRLAEALTETLCGLDAAHAEEYTARLEEYLRELDGLDAAFTVLAAGHGYPELLFGDRFPFLYFCRDYGFGYRAAFAGCSTETEPSALTMVTLIERAKAERAPVYYLENGDGRIAKAVGEAAGVPVLRLDSCQSITREDFENGETYLSLMWRNYETIQKGLTG